MKNLRYALFCGYNYEPLGGFNDIYDFYETLEEAIIVYNKILNTDMSFDDISELWKVNNPPSNKNKRIYRFYWAHVVDLQTKKKVIEKRCFARSKL